MLPHPDPSSCCQNCTSWLNSRFKIAGDLVGATIDILVFKKKFLGIKTPTHRLARTMKGRAAIGAALTKFYEWNDWYNESIVMKPVFFKEVIRFGGKNHSYPRCSR